MLVLRHICGVIKITLADAQAETAQHDCYSRHSRLLTFILFLFYVYLFATYLFDSIYSLRVEGRLITPSEANVIAVMASPRPTMLAEVPYVMAF